MKNSLRKSYLRNLMVLFSCVVMISLIGVQPSAGQNRQPREKPGGSVDERMTHLTEVLSLTDTQQTKIKVIMVKMRDEMKTMRDSASKGQRPDREEMKALRDQYDDQIENELTTEQKTLFREMLEKGKDRNKRNRKGRK